MYLTLLSNKVEHLSVVKGGYCSDNEFLRRYIRYDWNAHSMVLLMCVLFLMVCFIRSARDNLYCMGVYTKIGIHTKIDTPTNFYITYVHTISYNVL